MGPIKSMCVPSYLGTKRERIGERPAADEGGSLGSPPFGLRTVGAVLEGKRDP